jgi:hypothetical protein
MPRIKKNCFPLRCLNSNRVGAVAARRTANLAIYLSAVGLHYNYRAKMLNTGKNKARKLCGTKHVEKQVTLQLFFFITE